MYYSRLPCKLPAVDHIRDFSSLCNNLCLLLCIMSSQCHVAIMPRRAFCFESLDVEVIMTRVHTERCSSPGFGHQASPGAAQAWPDLHRRHCQMWILWPTCTSARRKAAIYGKQSQQNAQTWAILLMPFFRLRPDADDTYTAVVVVECRPTPTVCLIEFAGMDHLANLHEVGPCTSAP